MNEAQEKGLSQAIIKRTIRDLASSDMSLFNKAFIHLTNPSFPSTCCQAGYPPELLDTLRAMVRRSKAERKHIAKEVLDFLKENWDTDEEKNNPSVTRGY